MLYGFFFSLGALLLNEHFGSQRLFSFSCTESGEYGHIQHILGVQVFPGIDGMIYFLSETSFISLLHN